MKPLLLVVAYGYFCGMALADVQRVRTEVDIEGEIRFNPDGKGVQKRSLTAQGEVAFDQLVKQGQAARYYLRAEGRATVGKSTARRNLRPSHRAVSVNNTGARLTFSSPAGPLTRDELDVLEVQFDPLLLQELLPTGGMKTGATRNASNQLVASLFFVDVIHQNDIQSEVVESNDSSATIRIAGKASGAVEGVSTEIEVSGQLRFALDNAMVERVTLTIKEDRSISHASPGFHVTATIKSTISPLGNSSHLSPEVIDSLAKLWDSKEDLITYCSKHTGVRLLHDARWKVMADRPETLILRMVEQGDLVGQCNISRLVKLSAGEQPSLDRFKSDVRQALGENFAQLLDSTRSTTEDGRVVLRVAINGTASGLAVNWVYYHVSDASGRRVSLVFTSEAGLASRFAEADLDLVNSLRFDEPAPTPVSDQPANSGTEEQASKQLGRSTRIE